MAFFSRDNFESWTQGDFRFYPVGNRIIKLLLVGFATWLGVDALPDAAEGVNSAEWIYGLSALFVAFHLAHAATGKSMFHSIQA